MADMEFSDSQVCYTRPPNRRLGELHRGLGLRVVSSGSLALDRILVGGGLPCGCITELYGEASSGKTTLGLLAVARCQHAGQSAVLIDSECAMERSYAERLGVDTEALVYVRPDSAEQAVDMAIDVLKTRAVDLLMIDSVAALATRDEVTQSFQNIDSSAQVDFFRKNMRRLAAAVDGTEACCLLINQTRARMDRNGIGPDCTTAGGDAVRFFSSVRIELERGDEIVEGGKRIGERVNAYVVRNSLGKIAEKCWFDIYYGRGISRVAEVVDAALMGGMIYREGEEFVCSGVVLGRSREQTIATLRTMPPLFRSLERALMPKV